MRYRTQEDVPDCTRAAVLAALTTGPGQQAKTPEPTTERDEGKEPMSERVRVRVLLLYGDQAEIVADVPPAERAEPERYPADEIARAVGLPAKELPGRVLTADVGPRDRLSGWELA